jgi:hypothetical protein
MQISWTPLWIQDMHGPRDVDVLDRIVGDRYIPWRVKSSYSTMSCNLSDNNSVIETRSAEKVVVSLTVYSVQKLE